MTKSFKLIIESGPTAGTEFLLEKEDLTLGRDVNNDIMVNDPEVSRKHARLIKQGESYFFEDLGSTNGTFIAGERLSKPVLLAPNTKITIGERVQLRFVVEGFDASETMVARGELKRLLPPLCIVDSSCHATSGSACNASATTCLHAAAQPAYVPPVNRASAPVPPPTAPYPQAAPKKKSKALMVILIIIAIIVVFCVVPFVIIDLTDNWCNLFPGIFQMMGACL
jgi:hypothetical protein